MKWPFLLIWLAVLCVTTVAAAASNAEDDDDNHNNNNISDDDDDDDLIEENPNFEPWGENDSDYDHYDDDDDDESVPEEMNDAVLSPFQKSRQKRMAVWWKRNQMKIVSLVALYAFRHEIGRMIRFSARKHLTDPVSGKLQRPSLTAILKLVIFIDVMRRFTKGDSQTTATAVMLRSNPLLGLLMTNVLRPSNSAYIPPIRQHYTFERLNDRYRKDGWALQKALDPQGQYFTKEQLKQRTPCFATTVIVMDMTGLDTSVSSMESIQDQVSFLIGEHRGGTLAKSTSSKKNETTTTMEVVIRLESPGGSASDYALAAAQVLRLRKEEGVTVTIVVDKVAASGKCGCMCAGMGWDDTVVHRNDHHFSPSLSHTHSRWLHDCLYSESRKTLGGAVCHGWLNWGNWTIFQYSRDSHWLGRQAAGFSRWQR